MIPFGINAGNKGCLRTTSSNGHQHVVTSGGDAETRPPNAYVTYIIRY
jgi:hypothetical protein